MKEIMPLLLVLLAAAALVFGSLSYGVMCGDGFSEVAMGARQDIFFP